MLWRLTAQSKVYQIRRYAEYYAEEEKVGQTKLRIKSILEEMKNNNEVGRVKYLREVLEDVRKHYSLFCGLYHTLLALFERTGSDNIPLTESIVITITLSSRMDFILSFA